MSPGGFILWQRRGLPSEKAGECPYYYLKVKLWILASLEVFMTKTPLFLALILSFFLCFTLEK